MASVEQSLSASSTHKKQLKLYSHWRSSCSCRVRIALNLKGLSYDYIPVNLLKGEQFTPEFLKLNPIGYVPVLVDGDIVISDSLAILMHLEDKYPQHPLLPSDLQKKAISIQVATIVSSSIQPFQNLAVLNIIEEKISPDEKLPWAQFHIQKGFTGVALGSSHTSTIMGNFSSVASSFLREKTALEKLLKQHAGRYAVGDEVSLADVFLEPQIHTAIKMFNVDMTKFPLLLRLHEAYNELPAFQNGMPEKQPDTPSSISS